MAVANALDKQEYDEYMAQEKKLMWCTWTEAPSSATSQLVFCIVQVKKEPKVSKEKYFFKKACYLSSKSRALFQSYNKLEVPKSE